MRRNFATERTLIVSADASTRERASVVTQLERPAVRDVLDELLDFHAEIHAMLVQLDRVGFDVDVDVNALRSFLTGPLTWHDEDEEVTVLARLRRRRQWNEHLDHVTAGHEKLEDLLDRIVPLLDYLPASGQRLREATAQLRGLLVGHMKLEEEFLFPLARASFDLDSLADMRAEVHARHQRRRARRRGAGM